MKVLVLNVYENANLLYIPFTLVETPTTTNLIINEGGYQTFQQPSGNSQTPCGASVFNLNAGNYTETSFQHYYAHKLIFYFPENPRAPNLLINECGYQNFQLPGSSQARLTVAHCQPIVHQVKW